MQSMEILAELIMALPLSSFLEPTHEDVMKPFPCLNPKKYLPDLLIYEFSCLYHMKRV